MSTMNVVRMWIAIAILLYSIPFLQNRRIIQFLAVVVIASSFHSTALVFLLIYPLVKLDIRFKTIMSCLGVSIILFIIGRPVFIRITELIGRYGGYLDSNYFNYESNIAVYLTLAINMALFALIYNSMKRKAHESNSQESEIAIVSIEQICVICGLLVTAFSIIGLGNTIMDRISAYFSVFFPISLPLAFFYKKNNKNREIMLWILIIGLAAQYLVVMIYRPSWNGVTPYHFYWQQ